MTRNWTKGKRVRFIAVLSSLLACGCSIGSMLPDDRSFFKQPDATAWPGDRLSEAQFEAAVAHFAVPKPECNGPWRWALIAPNEWLLKGTRYRVVRVPSGSGYVVNIHYSRGYWGGEMPLVQTVSGVKAAAEAQAADDCIYEKAT